MSYQRIFALFDREVVLPSFLNQKEPVILYGAGNIGHDLMRSLSKKGISVVCFLDRKATGGETVGGVPMYHPEDNRIDKTKYPVIISIFNPYVNIPELKKNLYAGGYSAVYTIMDIYDFVSEEMGNRFWLAPRQYFKKSKDYVLKGYELWDDDVSRRLYEQIIEFRITGDYGLLPEPHQNPYFPNDIPKWRQPVRFIDAGAYDGDTLRVLLQTTYDIEAIAAFEPDLNNFTKLSEFIRNTRGKFGNNVSLYPSGVWSVNKSMSFATGHGEASMISDEGESTIQCVALDEVLPVFSPTLIKMDIEGAEYEALRGAHRLIKDYRPGLAICLYHHPDHIWNIPLLIKNWSLGYKFYIRCHCYSTFELVLYAVPE